MLQSNQNNYFRPGYKIKIVFKHLANVPSVLQLSAHIILRSKSVRRVELIHLTLLVYIRSSIQEKKWMKTSIMSTVDGTTVRGKCGPSALSTGAFKSTAVLFIRSLEFTGHHSAETFHLSSPSVCPPPPTAFYLHNWVSAYIYTHNTSQLQVPQIRDQWLKCQEPQFAIVKRGVTATTPGWI